MKSKLIIPFFILMFLMILAAAATASWLYLSYRDFNTASDKTAAVHFVVGKGDSLYKIAANLKDNQLIKNDSSFRLWTKLNKKDTKIKSGEYLIPAHATPRLIMDILSSGEVIVHKITFQEGLTTAEIIDILNYEKKLDGLVTEDFANLANGTLLPSTYYFVLGDSRESILNRMQSTFEQQASALWKSRQPNLPFESLFQAVILASLVEKEAAVPEERPLIASVFINRLQRKMKLQSDPTVIFAVTGGKNTLPRQLYYKDLQFDSPYNTYKYAGLPPAPICNVGIDSLKAVLNPAKTKYLYFVVNKDKPKTHIFSETFKKHHSNASDLRKKKKIERKRQKTQK